MGNKLTKKTQGVSVSDDGKSTSVFKGYKFKPEVVDSLYRSFLGLATVEQACTIAGITKETYYQWRKHYPDFALKMDKAQADPFMRAKKTVMDKIGDVETAKWLLEHKANKEFNTRIETESTFTEVPVILDDVPPDDKNKEK